VARFIPAGADCFPNGKHDDQVDATAQLLDWFKRGAGPTSNAGIFELYRQRAEELRRGQMPGPPVRLRAPSGVSHVQLFSGIHRAVAPDGTVEMTPEDAAPLLRAGWVSVDCGDPASGAKLTLDAGPATDRLLRGVDPRGGRGPDPWARNDCSNGSHCEERRDEAIPTKRAMTGVTGLLPTNRTQSGGLT